DARKFPVMKTLARFHGCDLETLYREVDASEFEVHEVLREMIANNEAEASPKPSLSGRLNEKFTLTLKGWGEYMKVLGTIYELPE
ncbi:MAG: hypothetical protein OK454_10870, partial [Thaumarchaeota archaeon]|nr:hypothetical protein [Nitrososphaerota archaeon]